MGRPSGCGEHVDHGEPQSHKKTWVQGIMRILQLEAFLLDADYSFQVGPTVVDIVDLNAAMEIELQVISTQRYQTN